MAFSRKSLLKQHFFISSRNFNFSSKEEEGLRPEESKRHSSSSSSSGVLPPVQPPKIHRFTLAEAKEEEDKETDGSKHQPHMGKGGGMRVKNPPRTLRSKINYLEENVLIKGKNRTFVATFS